MNHSESSQQDGPRDDHQVNEGIFLTYTVAAAMARLWVWAFLAGVFVGVGLSTIIRGLL